MAGHTFHTLFPCEIFPPGLHLRQVWPPPAELLVALALVVGIVAVVFHPTF